MKAGVSLDPLNLFGQNAELAGRVPAVRAALERVVGFLAGLRALITMGNNRTLGSQF